MSMFCGNCRSFRTDTMPSSRGIQRIRPSLRLHCRKAFRSGHMASGLVGSECQVYMCCMATLSDNAPAFHAHDHTDCSGAAIEHAEKIAAERGLRLTPVRRRVLEILLEGHRAYGAYEVLERLAKDGFANQPPVAYRALDFLVEHGFVHRVRRLNAFAACMHPGEDHEPAFFICEVCQTVAEAPEDRVQAAIGSVAAGIGFAVSRTSVEVVGRCPKCR